MTTSECCNAEVEVLMTGTYDPDDDGYAPEWCELECQQCGSIYFDRDEI